MTNSVAGLFYGNCFTDGALFFRGLCNDFHFCLTKKQKYLVFFSGFITHFYKLWIMTVSANGEESRPCEPRSRVRLIAIFSACDWISSALGICKKKKKKIITWENGKSNYTCVSRRLESSRHRWRRRARTEFYIRILLASSHFYSRTELCLGYSGWFSILRAFVLSSDVLLIQCRIFYYLATRKMLNVKIFIILS